MNRIYGLRRVWGLLKSNWSSYRKANRITDQAVLDRVAVLLLMKDKTTRTNRGRTAITG